MPFLTARWSNLCLLTYAVPQSALLRRLPPGLELDLIDGQAFVSLVAFDFLKTRVAGVAWPGHRNFAELNLRFYVRRAGAAPERGVVFIREFVPRRIVARLARAIYNEPYIAAPLASRVTESPGQIAVEHRLRFAGREHRVAVVGRLPATAPGPDSVEHFFKEHRWGFGMSRSGRLLRYEVVHPVWRTYPVISWELDLDWAGVYGPEWSFLAGAVPCSTILAEGSAVQVFPKSTPADGPRSPLSTSSPRSA